MEKYKIEVAMSCSRCGRLPKISIIVGPNKLVCQECAMHLKPFAMEIIRSRSHSHLYNATLCSVERVMTVEQYRNCGWFLRKKIERGTQVHYILEYHGKVKCARCVDYRFPFGMEKCRMYDLCHYRNNRLGNGALVGN